MPVEYEGFEIVDEWRQCCDMAGSNGRMEGIVGLAMALVDLQLQAE